jgi:NAD(P)-dependent dehydrogenase (short-subunit alcohol dehydrogenase family)
MEAIKYALPSLAIRQGCVVNVASSAGLGAEPYQGVEYAVAKAGVIRLTTALGTIDGVRDNCICPHTVATEAVLRSLETRANSKTSHLRHPHCSASTKWSPASGG